MIDSKNDELMEESGFISIDQNEFWENLDNERSAPQINRQKNIQHTSIQRVDTLTQSDEKHQKSQEDTFRGEFESKYLMEINNTSEEISRNIRNEYKTKIEKERIAYKMQLKEILVVLQNKMESHMKEKNEAVISTFQTEIKSVLERQTKLKIENEFLSRGMEKLREISIKQEQLILQLGTQLNKYKMEDEKKLNHDLKMLKKQTKQASKPQKTTIIMEQKEDFSTQEEIIIKAPKLKSRHPSSGLAVSKTSKGDPHKQRFLRSDTLKPDHAQIRPHSPAGSFKHLREEEELFSSSGEITSDNTKAYINHNSPHIATKEKITFYGTYISLASKDKTRIALSHEIQNKEQEIKELKEAIQPLKSELKLTHNLFVEENKLQSKLREQIYELLDERNKIGKKLKSNLKEYRCKNRQIRTIMKREKDEILQEFGDFKGMASKELRVNELIREFQTKTIENLQNTVQEQAAQIIELISKNKPKSPGKVSPPRAKSPLKPPTPNKIIEEEEEEIPLTRKLSKYEQEAEEKMTQIKKEVLYNSVYNPHFRLEGAQDVQNAPSRNSQHLATAIKERMKSIDPGIMKHSINCIKHEFEKPWSSVLAKARKKSQILNKSLQINSGFLSRGSRPHHRRKGHSDFAHFVIGGGGKGATRGDSLTHHSPPVAYGGLSSGGDNIQNLQGHHLDKYNTTSTRSTFTVRSRNVIPFAQHKYNDRISMSTAGTTHITPVTPKASSMRKSHRLPWDQFQSVEAGLKIKHQVSNVDDSVIVQAHRNKMRKLNLSYDRSTSIKAHEYE